MRSPFLLLTFEGLSPISLSSAFQLTFEGRVSLGTGLQISRESGRVSLGTSLGTGLQISLLYRTQPKSEGPSPFVPFYRLRISSATARASGVTTSCDSVETLIEVYSISPSCGVPNGRPVARSYAVTVIRAL
jgi:hypothetical protein